MATLVLGALEGEVAFCRTELAERREERWCGSTLSVGRLGGSRVAVGETGVGKAMAAIATQHWIDALTPERVFFVGTAGALNPQLEVGDAVIAKDAVQYDLDARAAGFELGRVPLSDFRRIPSDPHLVEAALGFRPAGYRVTDGRILTGDRMVLQDEALLHDAAFAELEGDAIEMEGASAGLTALVNGVPFLLIRVISDRADAEASRDFAGFLATASKRLLEIVVHVLSVVDAA